MAAIQGGIQLHPGSITAHLVALSLPMVWGILSVIAFNLADTFFVGLLGTAAGGAVVHLPGGHDRFLACHWPGHRCGIGDLVYRGHSDRTAVRRLITDSIWLVIGMVLVFMSVGMATIEPLFHLPGAGTETLPLVTDYMQFWYLGLPFMIVPMIANGAMRACRARLSRAVQR